jgi:hypothetical protein
MKIHEYNEMMAYLTRPSYVSGGRVGYQIGALVQAPKIGSQIVKAGQYLKNLLVNRPVRAGMERTRPKTDYSWDQTFTTKFKEFADKYFAGNWTEASKSIGVTREKVKSIFQGLAPGKRSYGEIATGGRTIPTLDIPLGTKSVKDITTDLKYNPEILTEKIKKLTKQGKVREKNFYNSKDVANILGVDPTKYNLKTLHTVLTNNKVLSKYSPGYTKEYSLGDVSKKIRDWSSIKRVKGDVKAKTERLKIEAEWDFPLTKFLDNLKNQTRSLSKDADIYVRNAVEDIGHAQSIKTVSKYPNLFKNSNVKSMQTLTYQDPHINQEIFQNQGFQGRYEGIFKELNKFVNKKVTKENIKDLNLIRDKLKENYTNLTKRIIAEAKDNPYFKGQEKRIPELKLTNLKIGDTFKSENIFADMSTVDSHYIVGQISKINPTAKKFSDLTPRQVEFYKQTIKNQTMDNLEKFYKKVGYSADEIEELKDVLEIGSATKRGLNEGGRVGLQEGTMWGKTKSVGKTTWRGLERSAGPWMTPLVGLYTAITGEAPDMTKPENLLLPAFWNQLMKKYKWEDKRTDPIKKRITNFLKRGTIPTRLMPFISKISGYALGPAELYQAVKAAPAKEERIAEVARDKGWDVDETLNMYRMTHTPEFSRDFFYKKMFGKTPDLSTVQDVIKSPEYKERKKYFTNAAIDQYWENKRTDPIRTRTLGPDVMEGSVINKYNQGGRVNLAKGFDPKRRLVLKGLGALALLPVVGKYFKAGQFLSKAGAYTGPVVQKIKGMPEWFPGLVKRLWNEGDDATKALGTKEREIVRGAKLESGDDVHMYYELDSGNVRVEVTPAKTKTGYGYETESGAFHKGYGAEVRKGEDILDETTGRSTKTKDEFSIVEEEHVGGPEDVDFDIKETSVDDAITDLTEMEAFAKKKTTKQIHKKKGTKKKDVWPEGNWDPDDEFFP